MFSFSPEKAITTFAEAKAVRPLFDRAADEVVKIGSGGSSENDISNQFCVFQFNPVNEGPSLLDSSAVEPSFDGSDDFPDVRAALEMLAFHIGEGEDIDQNTRATMRLNLGMDEKSTNRIFDTVYWSIAAGLNLYDEARGNVSNPTDLRSDFRSAFGNRPIDIPGGLGLLSFEVVKHEEPEWWQKIFSFFGTKTAERLISVLGFPAITQSAIGVIDELLGRVGDINSEPLFQSLPMTLALTGRAREELTGGNLNVKVGALSKGYFVLARGRDVELFNQTPLTFHTTYRKLVPRDAETPEIVSGHYDDPLADATYAVFRVGMQEARLDPMFDFNA